VQRVKESSDVLRNMGAAVTAEIYPGIGHTITREELDWVNNHMLPPKIL
jgi:phospholipase/carboxylesterase